jgi:Asp/Glu/hydantoin racemase
MKILYQNVVPYRGYESYALAQEVVLSRFGLGQVVTFSWLRDPDTKFPDGSEEEMARIDQEVVDSVLEVYESYDYIVIGCALDSGVEILWRDYRRRVFGAGEILYRLAAWQGKRFAVMIPENSMMPQYDRLLQRYRAQEMFVGFESLDMTNQEMIGDARAVVERLSVCLHRLRHKGALDQAIVACTLASANLVANLDSLEIDDVFALDLISLPVRFCLMLAANRQAHSQVV